MQKYDSDISITNHQRYVEKNHTFLTVIGNEDVISSFEGCHTGTEWLLLRFKYERCLGIYTQPWGKLYKRFLWKNVWFPHDRKVAEDDRTTWKVFLKATKVSFERHDDYCWRKHSGEISSVFDDVYQDYKTYEIQHVYPIQEQIAVLSTLGVDLSSSWRFTYRSWVNIAWEHALRFGDFSNYKKFEFRQLLLQRKINHE